MRNVGSIKCGRALRKEGHEAHPFSFQASDDSPEEVVGECPGYTPPSN
jgi:hypothetical protein